MKIDTNWISPPQSIGGRDHLGTQAPCVLIYSQLLPGITNVTDRARYYSFYPWLIWSFDQRYPKDEMKFVEFFRRADCLFTLISERHARITDRDNERHGVGAVWSRGFEADNSLRVGGACYVPGIVPEPRIILGIANGIVSIFDFDNTRQFQADRVMPISPRNPSLPNSGDLANLANPPLEA